MRHAELYSPAIGAAGNVLVYGHWGRPVLAFPGHDLVAGKEGGGSEQGAGPTLTGKAVARRHERWLAAEANAQPVAGAGRLVLLGRCHPDGDTTKQCGPHRLDKSGVDKPAQC